VTRCLTKDELSKIDAGWLPVLSAIPAGGVVLILCIGWARSESEALSIMVTHPDVQKSVEVPGLSPVVLASATKNPIMVGDIDGLCLPEFRQCHPGTYFVIEAFVPTYLQK
jgi:hypothetical protein